MGWEGGGRCTEGESGGDGGLQVGAANSSRREGTAEEHMPQRQTDLGSSPSTATYWPCESRQAT